jgi:UrcA family protein
MTILLFLASLTAGPGAPAVPIAEQGRTATVRFADLDLSTSAGRATLDRRVKRAVRHVCALAGPTKASDFEQVGACRQQALKDATRQIELAAGSTVDAAELWASK